MDFTTTCSKIQPQKVVTLMNNLDLLLEFLVNQNAVYKVETIGDAYLIVAGCPVKVTNHASRICDISLDMIDAFAMLRYPGMTKAIDIRIGCHSGPVVAGTIGNKIPRYVI